MRILILSFCFGAVSTLAVGKPAELERARSAVSEWVEVEKAISLEESNWREEQLLLGDLIDLAEAKIARLERELSESAAVRTSSDERRAVLLEQEASLSEKLEVIEVFLAETESRLRQFEGRLPEPLQADLKVSFQRLPRNPEESSFGPGARMQTVVGLLSGIRDFDGKITISEETRQIPGRMDRGRFRTLWLGLSQAYYLAPADAGFGKPGPNGWEWHSRPELAESIAGAIAIAEQSAVEPKLIDLPVDFRKGRE